MTDGERRELIERYRDGARAVEEALEDLREDELDRRPSPEDWTVREIVHHLGDAEMRSAVRLRQLLAEDAALIQGYDEAEYTRRLHYDRPLGASLDAMRAARRTSLELLETLTPAEWTRAGTHSESGAYAVDDWLRIYAAHPHEHAAQIRRVRG